MKRRLLNLLTALSLLLCVAVAALWVRSEWRCDCWFRNDERTLDDASEWVVASSRGAVWLYHERYNANDRQNRGPALYQGVESMDKPPSVMLMIDPMFDQYVDFGQSYFHHAWFAWNFAGEWRDGSHRFICPDWSLMLLAALLPAGRYIGWRIRRHRRTAGKCARCGYDLTGNVSGVCPECGKVR